jgi:hypothetical protein
LYAEAGVIIPPFWKNVKLEILITRTIVHNFTLVKQIGWDYGYAL